MNKKERKEKIYKIGDLVCFVGGDLLALVVAKLLSHLFDVFEYRVLFCSDDTPDDRWLFGSVLDNVTR